MAKELKDFKPVYVAIIGGDELSGEYDDYFTEIDKLIGKVFTAVPDRMDGTQCAYRFIAGDYGEVEGFYAYNTKGKLYKCNSWMGVQFRLFQTEDEATKYSKENIIQVGSIVTWTNPEFATRSDKYVLEHTGMSKEEFMNRKFTVDSLTSDMAKIHEVNGGSEAEVYPSELTLVK